MSRMARTLNKDTQLCISLAARPSNHGTRFHNFLYEELDLNFVYKAFAPTNLEDAIRGIRGLPIRGAAVSMPYKEQCIPMLDELSQSAAVIASVNTIVNTDGHLKAYNTDYLAIASLLASHQVDRNDEVDVLARGGRPKAVVAALHDAGFATGTVVARNEATGGAVAEQYGFGWQAELGALRPSLLINATPIGMAGGEGEGRMPVASDVVGGATTVFDVVASPSETPLIQAARAARRKVITGAEVVALQAAEQFELYTGVRPTHDQVQRASAFARSA